MRAGKISVGIGSWTDKEYVGVLFPKGVKADERLKLYATKLGHVEVNAGYHAFQPRERVAAWVAQTPPDFKFDFKLHRAFSQSPEKSAGDADVVSRLLDSAGPIIEAGKLGAFFMTLATSFGPEKKEVTALEPLIEKLRPQLLAVELRNRGWLEGDEHARTIAFFRSRGAILIGVDMPRGDAPAFLPPVDEVTNPKLAYLRLHGRRADWLTLEDVGERHSYDYSPAELDEITERVRRLAQQADVVHVVANNHAQDFAPKTALALQERLGLAPC